MKMRTVILLSICLYLPSCASTGVNRPAIAADHQAIASAIADNGRPEPHRLRDPLRKPAELMAFAGVRRGLKIGEFLPVGAAGIGYFTRIFSPAIGPEGRIYGHVPTEHLARSPRDVNSAITLEKEERLANLTILRQPTLSFAPPEQLDLYWTSLNYHDVPLELVTPDDLVAFNRSVFDALKPGGLYVIVDHAASIGSGLRDLKLHRIDPQIVKQQVIAAGFELDAESELLDNPADTHTLNVFDPAVRGKTDQFVLRFRKPQITR